MLHRIPIVPVFVVGGGYDYGHAREQLADLRATLDENALGVLRSRQVSLPEMSRRLSAALPSLISVPFDPAEADEAGINASVEHILRRLGRASCASSSSS